MSPPPTVEFRLEFLLPISLSSGVNLVTEALQAVTLNACEAYTTEKGTDPESVTLRVLVTGTDPHPYAIQISDQGIGISDADLPLGNKTWD